MRSMGSKILLVLGIVAGSLGSAGNARAGLMLSGSLPLAGVGVSENGGDLQSSTIISSVKSVTIGPGTGSYSPIGLLTDFGATTLDKSNLTSFTINNATWGNFTTTSGMIVTQTPSFLDVLLQGEFNPGPGLAGFMPTPTTLRVSYNKSGSSISEAITLHSTPSSIVLPELSTLTSLGIGTALVWLSHAFWGRAYRTRVPGVGS
jgi:hypothetical protein